MANLKRTPGEPLQLIRTAGKPRPESRQTKLALARLATGDPVRRTVVLQLDFGNAYVALKTILVELDFATSGLLWVVTSYALTFGSLHRRLAAWRSRRHCLSVPGSFKLLRGGRERGPRIAESHGGTIFARPRATGSAFTLVLPQHGK